MHLIDFPKVNSHIHFVDDAKELADEEYEEDIEEQRLNIPEVDEIIEMTQQKKKAYKKLDEQINKGKNYKRVYNALTMQKHLMVSLD